MPTRFHVASREPIARAGGLHNYVLSLAEGQRQLGLHAPIAHKIARFGSYSMAAGEKELTFDDLTAEDSVHLHFAQSARLMRPALRGTRAQLIFHFHGPWATEGRVQGDSRLKQAAKWALERSEYRRYGTFVVASDAFADVLAKNYGIAADRISTVYPGVDTLRFTPGDRSEARVRLGIDPHRPTISCVRRLEPRMGLFNALEVAERLPEVQLLIAGTGSIEQDLRERINNRALGNRVHLLGRVDESRLPDVFRAGDATLVPTLALEGFGLIVLESMACGTPVISTRVGGLPEAMGPFADAFSVEDPSDINSMMAMFSTVLGDGPKLGAAARAYAETKSLQGMARAVERVVRGASDVA